MSNYFDIKEFNKLYEKNIQKKIVLRDKKDIIEVQDDKKTLYELSIGEIFINFKNIFFEILDDLQSFNTLKSFFSIFVKKESFKSFLIIFIKKNRSFYSGLLLILISLIIYIISEIFFTYKLDITIYKDASKINDNNIYYNRIEPNIIY